MQPHIGSVAVPLPHLRGGEVTRWRFNSSSAALQVCNFWPVISGRAIYLTFAFVRLRATQRSNQKLNVD